MHSAVFSVCPRIPLCSLINQHLSGLAAKFPDVKFIKAISTTCIPNYPDRNLPTVFVYLEGDIRAQFIGPLVFGGMNLTRDGEDRGMWGASVSPQRLLGVCLCFSVASVGPVGFHFRFQLMLPLNHGRVLSYSFTPAAPQGHVRVACDTASDLQDTSGVFRRSEACGITD